MAGLFFDSFDSSTTIQIPEKWTQLMGASTGTVTLTAAAGARGTYGIQFDHNSGVGSTQALSVTLGPASKLAIGGANFISAAFGTDGNLAGGVTAGAVISIQDVGSYQLRLRLQPDGTIAVYGGGDAQYGGATKLGQTVRALQAGVQYYVWMKALIATGIGGSVEIMVGGDVWLTLSGVTTQYSSNSAQCWNMFTLGPASGINTYSYDDVAVLDGSGSVNNDIPCAHLRIDAIYANGAGTYTQFTKHGAATNYQCINEGSVDGGTGNDGDTTYNDTDVIGNRDSFTFENIPVITATIIAVQRNLVARAPTAGGSSLAGTYRKGGVDYDGTGSGLTTSYGDIPRDVLDLNPDGGAWVDSDLITPNEWGYTKTA